MILETERLTLREMEQKDFQDLAEILQNPNVMYAYEHDFSETDVQEWLDRQIGRYRKYGFGWWGMFIAFIAALILSVAMTKKTDMKGKY